MSIHIRVLNTNNENNYALVCVFCTYRIYFNEFLTGTIFQTIGHFNSDNSILNITRWSIAHAHVTICLHI